MSIRRLSIVVISLLSISMSILTAIVYSSIQDVRSAEIAWIKTGGPPGGLGYDIRMRPDNPDIMYVTDANAGVHTSMDGGLNWRASNQGINLRSGGNSEIIPVFSLTIDPNDFDTIWVGLSGLGGVYRSIDGGNTWELRNSGIKESVGFTVRGMSIEPGNSNVVYAAGEISSWLWAGESLQGKLFDLTQGVVYRSTNGGEFWNEIWRGNNLARYVLIDPNDPDVLYVSTGIFDREAANTHVDANEPGGVGIVKSTDGGDSWEVLDAKNGLTGLYVGSLSMHPEDSQTLLAGAGHDYWSRPYDQDSAPADAGAFISHNGGLTWEKTLEQDMISSVEFCDGNPNIVYAAGDRSFYRSEDQGITWQQKGIGSGREFWGPPGIVAGIPIDMQCDPRDPSRLFVNNYQGGNFLTLDGGNTWMDVSNGYTGATIYGDLVVDPTDSQRVFSGGKSGLFRSIDGGSSWQGLAFPPARHGQITAIGLSPANTDIIINSIWDLPRRLARSIDGGNSWEIAWMPADRESQTLEITFSPSNPNTVYAGRGSFECRMNGRHPSCDQPGDGIYVSHDSGLSWEAASDEQIEDKHVSVISIHPENPNIVYAGTVGAGIFKTVDGGNNWSRLSLTARVVRGLSIDPREPETIYAGTSGGVFISEDGGMNWHWSSAGLDPEILIRDLELDPSDPSRIWIADHHSGIYVSNNKGQTWTAVNQGLSIRSVLHLAVSSNGQTLYAGTNGGGVFRLDLNGQ